MEHSGDKYEQTGTSWTPTAFRPAEAADVQVFVSMIDSLDDPALLFGPKYSSADGNFRGWVPGLNDIGAALRSPVGSLGYRYTSVIELDGRVAGFGIMVPLERLEGTLLGPLLPVELALDRYDGDLSTVIDFHLMAVDPALHSRRPSIPLLRWCLAEAARQGYRHMIAQRWDRHLRSARFFEKHGGFRPFHRVEARYDENTWDAFTFIDRRLDDDKVWS